MTEEVGSEKAVDERRETKPISLNRAAGPDLLRSLAILLVMLWHLPKVATPSFLAGVKPFGWIGVDLFFVLSGYLIGAQLMAKIARGERLDLADFYLRRSVRILPAFLVVLALYAAFPVMREAQGMLPLWRFLTFTMNFDLEYQLTGTFSHAWSLCVEEHFYLILPMLLLVPFRSAVPVVGLALAIVLVGMLLRFEIWQEGVGERLEAAKVVNPSRLYFESIYYPTYARLDGLVFGVLLAAARVFRPAQWQRYFGVRLSFALGGLLLAGALVLLAHRGGLPPMAHLPALSLPGAVVAYPLLALAFTLILSASLDAEMQRRFRVPGAASIALLSYSLYLTHKAVMHLDEVFIGTDRLPAGTGLLVYFATSFATAALLWALVERPFLQLRSRLLAPSAVDRDSA